VITCFTSASVANRLPARCFLRGPKMVEITGPHTANWTGYSTWPQGYRTPCIQPDLVLSDTQNKQTIYTHTHAHTHRTNSIIRCAVSEFLDTNLKTVFNNLFTRCKGCLIVEDNFQHLLKHAVKLYCTLQTDNVDSISAFRLQLDIPYTGHTTKPLIKH